MVENVILAVLILSICTVFP